MATSSSAATRSSEWLVGGGEMGEFIRTSDWSSTPLGPRDRWPSSLRTAVNLVVDSPFPVALLWGPTLRLLFNDACRTALAEPPRALGGPLADAWPELWALAEPHVLAVMARGEAARLEGEGVAARISLGPTRLGDGSVGGVLVTFQGASEQRVEAALGASEQRYSAIFDASPYGLALTRLPDGIFTTVNDAFLELIGLERAEVLDKSGVELGLVDLELRDQIRAELAERGEIRGRQVVHVTKTGRRRVLSLNLDWVTIEPDTYILTTINDVTAERQAEEERLAEAERRAEAERALSAAQSRYRALVEAAADAIVTISDRAAIESFNPAAEAMFGCSAAEAVGNAIDRLLPAPHGERGRAYVERYLAAGDGRPGLGRELVARRPDGTRFPVHLAVSEFRMNGDRMFACFIRDLTEHKALEEQYRHSQKMEAIGTLTTGIAHDFGNLLMGIAGCANIALGKLDPESAAAGYVRQLFDSATKGADLTRQLMSFSRKRRSEVKPLDLESVVRDAESLLRRLVGDDIDLRVDARATGLMKADLAQLEQILVNLVVNARDAMPEGGEITIRAGEATLKGGDAERLDLPPGRYAVLSVRDTGHGMDEETRSRVFEPFFTTKAPGQGTGLGLSNVYGIARQLGGGVQLYSEPGRGTELAIYFPRLQTFEVEVPAIDVALPRGHETVLLVDDDRLVRLTVRYYLESLGYRVIETSTPTQAVRHCKWQPDEIDLLLSDVVMPGMGGHELARRARRVSPGIRVLFMSAHPAEELLSRGRLSEDDELLSKPFSRAELATAVREVLDRGQGRPGPEARGGETVLIAEDSGAVRLAVGDYLEGLGYRTLRAARASEAISLADRQPSAIGVILTDLVLPDMSGDELAKKLRETQPDARVIYMSGQSWDVAVLEPGDRFLEKPIDLETVADAVRAAIGD